MEIESTMQAKLQAELHRPDLALAEENGWYYRRDFHDGDFCSVVAVYENDEYHLCDSAPGRRDEVIIDVGGHVGAFSRLAYLRNRKARIFAIEANPANIPVLHANIGDFATIIPAALTYEPGDVALLDSIYPGTLSTGGSIVLPAAEVAEYTGEQYIPRPEPLPTITLEKIVADHGIDFVDVLKLDCEGSEHSILRGTASLDRVGIILGEYHSGKSKWYKLVEDCFPPGDWFHIARNHHDHMGLFTLVNLRRKKV